MRSMRTRGMEVWRCPPYFAHVISYVAWLRRMAKSALSDVILRRVLLSGDVELNPGPALGEFIT